MALDLTPEQKTTGKANFQRVVGKMQLNRRQMLQAAAGGGIGLAAGAAAYFGYNNSSFRERPVKAGLIGAGDEGGVLIGEHNPAFVEFIAYSDIRPYNQSRIFDGEPTGLRKGFKHHYGADCQGRIQLYENYRDLLANPEIEMVVIALPLNLHKEATVAALNAGKHVLCEKLMGWNVQQCRAMIQAAQRNDKLLSIGHQRHYSTLYAHAVEVMGAGQLGHVRHIRALWHRENTGEYNAAQERYSRDGWRPVLRAEDVARLNTRDLRPYGYKNLNELVRWRLYRRTGGGLMAELGSHQLDACGIFINALRTDEERARGQKRYPIAVTGYGGRHFYPQADDREVEDHVYCIFEFPGKDYNPRIPQRDARGIPVANDLVTVTYSSVSTNAFEAYGECVMGSRGTMIVEQEKDIYLFGNDGRSTSVTASGAGLAAVDSSASGPPAERTAVEVGAATLGAGVPSRGYREEMDHLAYCIRARDEGMSRERTDLQPRCDGKAAMADAILALAANAAMRTGRRIEFNPDWFDPTKDALPGWDLPEEPA